MKQCQECGEQLTDFIPIYVEGVGVDTPPYEREDGGFVCLNPQCRMSYQFSNTRIGVVLQHRRMSVEEYDDFLRGCSQFEPRLPTV